MQARIVQRPTETLATAGPLRRISQIDRRQIEVRWDCLVLHMRTIDLCVLHEALEQLLTTFDMDAEEEYALAVNQTYLRLTRYDLAAFRAMVRNATDTVPHHVIRWREVKVALHPCHTRRLQEIGGFSIN